MIICKDKDNRVNKQNKVKIICQNKNQCFLLISFMHRFVFSVVVVFFGGVGGGEGSQASQLQCLFPFGNSRSR